MTIHSQILSYPLSQFENHQFGCFNHLSKTMNITQLGRQFSPYSDDLGIKSWGVLKITLSTKFVFGRKLSYLMFRNYGALKLGCFVLHLFFINTQSNLLKHCLQRNHCLKTRPSHLFLMLTFGSVIICLEVNFNQGLDEEVAC